LAIAITSMLILPSNLTLLLPLANAGRGGTQPISKDSITSPNQDFPVASNTVSGSDVPKNMIAGSNCWNWR
jgi:hypothetical protein